MDELKENKLRLECSPSLVSCEHTNEIAPLEEIVGQEFGYKGTGIQYLCGRSSRFW